MKIMLFMILCSSVAQSCLQPLTDTTIYSNHYDCLIKGYENSLVQITEIGKDDVNEFGIYAKFECKEIILPPAKPKKPVKMVNFVDLPKDLKNGH